MGLLKTGASLDDLGGGDGRMGQRLHLRSVHMEPQKRAFAEEPFGESPLGFRLAFI